MARRTIWLGFIIVMMLGAATGCDLISRPGGQDGVTPSPSAVLPGGVVEGLAQVDRVDVLMLESFPVQINVLAFGNLPDTCTVIDSRAQEREGDTFRITLTTSRPADQVCGEALTPFQESIPIEATGLKAGTYTVDVNGVTATFTLPVDNFMPGETPAVGTSGSISGMVWEDACLGAGEGGENPTPEVGCEAIESGGFRANGLQDAGEPPLVGVRVDLGAGPCPSSGQDAQVTGPDGTFQFDGLGGGTYCVSIDPLSEPTLSVLVPGDWSYPQPGVGSQNIELVEGQAVEEVNFGWDYQLK